MHTILASVGGEEVIAICGVLVALAVPLNTFLGMKMLRRQKEGNHHTETIRQLASALSETPSGAPPEEIGERVTETLAEEEKSRGPQT